MSSHKVLALLIGGTFMLAGCATEKYVDEKVAAVQAQITTQQQQIGALDARTAAVERAAQEALQRANAAAQGKFTYNVVATVDVGPFRVGRSKMPEEAQAQLADLANQLKSANRGVSIEIQGYTDETGSAESNYKLGWNRAESVRRFLAQQGVALNRMASVSYGEDVQKEGGRKENRRVVVVVLE